MMITITVSETVDDKIIRVSRSLTDIELEYAAFDIACYTIKKLREEVEQEKQKCLQHHHG